MTGDDKIKLAYEAILRSDFEQAIFWFEQAIELEPNHAAYHYKLSITCARSNRITKALEHAEQAVALCPDDPSYTFHLNHVKARQRIAQAEAAVERNGSQLYMAIALLREAISLDPLSVEAYLLMGIAYADLGEYSDAIQSLKEAVKLHPEHEGASGLLREYQKRVGQQFGGPAVE